jgi:simple sugar transport system ATP-binding protein
LTPEPLLQTRGISKRFGGVLANDRIDFDLRQGEIHALLGENGAGKTTLMNILSGLYRPDTGEIFHRGARVAIHSPREASKIGIHMVHQHFMLVPMFTVAENVVLGAEPVRWGRFDREAARESVRRLAKRYRLGADPDLPVESLPVGLQQRVEILKAMYRRAEILILDEPTAVLAPGEVAELFGMLRELAAAGVGCVFISHKLAEVMAVADRISVLRRGRIVASVEPSQTTEARLAEMMIGRPLAACRPRSRRFPGELVLAMAGVCVRDDRGETALQGIDLAVRAGEILGIAGIQGSGQRELAQALAGLRDLENGAIHLAGRRMPRCNPRAMIAGGMGHIPEDRRKHGLVAAYSVADNQVLPVYDRPPFARRLVRNRGAVRDHSLRLIRTFDIRVSGPEVRAAGLSGGNQQKVILSRELGRPIRFLLANQPTRGLDIAAAREIHQRLNDLCDHGAGLILISSELDEIVDLCDRVAVLYRGRIVAEAAAGEISRLQLGLLMATGGAG